MLPLEQQQLTDQSLEDLCSWPEDLDDRRAFRRRLEWLMGCQVHPRLASRMHTQWRNALRDPVTFATTHAEVAPLAQLVDWSSLLDINPSPVLLDPCTGEGNILASLAEEVPSLGGRALMYGNDVNSAYPADFHFDCLQPEEWRAAPLDIDVLICSPPFELADPIFSDLALRAGLFAACHLPGDYVSNGPPYRRAWWAWLQSQGRTAELRGLPRVPLRGTRRCSWFFVWRSSELRDRLWASQFECFTLFE